MKISRHFTFLLQLLMLTRAFRLKLFTLTTANRDKNQNSNDFDWTTIYTYPAAFIGNVLLWYHAK